MEYTNNETRNYIAQVIADAAFQAGRPSNWDCIDDLLRNAAKKTSISNGDYDKIMRLARGSLVLAVQAARDGVKPGRRFDA